MLERRKRKKEKKDKKKKEIIANSGGEAATGMAKPVKAIPKIDDHSPSSSIIDLQQKLDQISSPTSAVSSSSASSLSDQSIP